MARLAHPRDCARTELQFHARAGIGDGKELALWSDVGRLPTPPRLPRFDEDDDDAQPTTVAPWRTAVALATFEDPPASSDRESGIRALLESALSSFEIVVDVEAAELDDPGRTQTLVRPKSDVAPKTTYAFVARGREELEDFADIEDVEDVEEVERATVPERPEDGLSALLAVYEERPKTAPPPPPVPVAAPIPRSAVPTARRPSRQPPRREIDLAIVRARAIRLIERWAALDIRLRLAVLFVWTGLCSIVTALLVR